MPTPITVLVSLGDIGGGDGQLGKDLVERGLSTRKSELVLEQGGLGRVSIGVGEVQPLHRINQLLGSGLSLLHEAGDVVKHGWGLWGFQPKESIRLNSYRTGGQGR